MLLCLNISRVPQLVALKVHLIRTETALWLDKEGLTFLENFMLFEWGHPNSTSSIFLVGHSPAYSDVLDFYTFSVVLQLEPMSESFVGRVETHVSGPLPPTELLSQFSWDCCCCSVAQSCPTLLPHGLQHVRLPCPSPSPTVCSSSCPLSWWCHPTISSGVIPFSSCL